MAVTLPEKVLVHLLPYTRDGDRDAAVAAQTQAGIATALRARRSHVTQTLHALRRRGEVEERTVRVAGGQRRQKAYWPTSLGYAKGVEARDRLAAMPVLVDGDGARVPLGQVAGKLGGLRDALAFLRPDGVLDFSPPAGVPPEVVVALQVRCPHCDAAFTAIGAAEAPKAIAPLR